MRLSGKLPATVETRRKQQPEVIEAPCCSNRSSATLHIPVRPDIHSKYISGMVCYTGGCFYFRLGRDAFCEIQITGIAFYLTTLLSE